LLKKRTKPDEFQSSGVVGGQLSLEQTFDKSTAWNSKEKRSVALDRAVLEMIAIGNYPFTIVNEIGFRRVVKKLEPRASLKRASLKSDKYYRTQLEPTYAAVVTKMKQKITNASYISFTSDAWANKCNTASLLSITAHYVDFSTGSRPKVILAAVPLESDHTAEHFSSVIVEEVLRK